MTAPPSDVLVGLLRDVSRSFYLTLRLLPAPVRTQIGTAYLLARATDTVADTAVLAPEDRLAVLGRLRDRILGSDSVPLDFSRLAENQALPAERILLGRIEEVIGVLNGFPCFDRCCVREVVETIISGQELDLRRFHEAGVERVVALKTDQELEDYTYRVAGCVGKFWTRICRCHLFPQDPLDLPQYLDDAVRFGKGLQWVNILRDLPADLRQGRCYMPAESLGEVGLTPVSLLDPEVEERFRPIFRPYLEHAVQHLAAGWRYTCLTPRRQVRLRIACALPVLIGAETLRLLAKGNVLDGSRRLKVSRRRVKMLFLKTLVLHPFPACWERLFRQDLPASGCATVAARA